jgi:GT2 family glycosyltransferase
MPEPTLLTVILNWRTPKMTLDAATAALREMAGIAGEITIVDNDSQDGSFETIAEAIRAAGWDRVRVIQAGRNGGYGAGNNFGIRAGLAAGGLPDYVYILNSDAFPDPGAIQVLLDYLEGRPAVGFAGSYIHSPDGEPHQTAFRFPSIWGELEGAARCGPITRLLARHVVPLPIPEGTREVDWLAGASVMMRRSVLDAIGLFDERFFLYFEETDLCRRARLAGWPTVYLRASEVTHIGSASTGMTSWSRTPGYWFDSRLHYFVKNHGPAYAAAATLAHLVGGLIWRTRALIKRKPSGDPPRFLRDLAAHAGRACLRSLRPGSAPAALPNPTRNRILP